MKIEWNEWNTGGKVIFVSACLAVVSCLMPWIDIGIASRSGISSGGVLLLGCYVYPVLRLLKKQSIDMKWGLLSSIGATVLSLGFIMSRTAEFMGRTINASGTGAFLFLIASIVLIVGVVKYTKDFKG